MTGFIGSGKVLIAPYDEAVVFEKRDFGPVGNASVFKYSFSEKRVELPDYQDPAGGTDSAFARLDKIDGLIDFRDFSPSNFATVLWGSTSPLSSSDVPDEAHIIKVGRFFPAKRMIDKTKPVTIKKGATTLAESDYVVSSAGIYVAPVLTTSGIADGDSVTMSYTSKAAHDVQALIKSAPLVSIMLDGVNNVTGKAALGRYWKAKLGVASQVEHIGEDFGTLPVAFTLLKDQTITGSGVSKFLNLELED